MDTPVCGDGEEHVKTLADMIESTELVDDTTIEMESLVQGYINRNKIIEAILIDNIVNNDVQKHFKKVIKTVDSEGNPYKYTEHSSEFWPYRLVQIVSKLPANYKQEFMSKYCIAEEKLDAVLGAVDKATNQKLYKYLRATLDELRVSYAV
jgi:hypothetical protein